MNYAVIVLLAFAAVTLSPVSASPAKTDEVTSDNNCMQYEENLDALRVKINILSSVSTCEKATPAGKFLKLYTKLLIIVAVKV